MMYNSKLLLSALVLLGGSVPVQARNVEVAGAEEVVSFEVDERFQWSGWRDTLGSALPRGLLGRPAGGSGVTTRGVPKGVLPRGTVSRGEVSSSGTARVRVGSTGASLLGVPARWAGARSLPSGVVKTESLVGDLLREANSARRRHGARALVMDPAMTRVAERYARELARRGEVEHLSPTPGLRTFRERIASEGVRARVGGENLARLTASERLLGERTVRAWLESPGHRVNLLDPIFARTGIGVWLGADGIWYVVQVYATES